MAVEATGRDGDDGEDACAIVDMLEGYNMSDGRPI